MENPLFNLFTVDRKELNYYMNEFDPERYQFCSYCPDYKPEGIMHKLLRSPLIPMKAY
jgi:hypothetical protein